MNDYGGKNIDDIPTIITDGTNLLFADTVFAGFGATDSLSVYHTGVTGVLDNDIGDLQFINYGPAGNIILRCQNITSNIINKLGTDTSATAFDVESISGINLFTVLGNGQVSIGNATPPVTSKFHVELGSSGATPAVDSVMTLESSADGFLSILAPDTNSTGILFGNVTTSAHAGIHHRNGDLVFRNGGNKTRLTITDDGSLINILGSDDFSTSFNVQGANQEDIFRVTGNGRVMLGGGIFPIAQFQIDGNLNQIITGDVDIQIGTPIVSGVGTAFQDELEPGNAIKINNQVFTVLSITNQSLLTLDSNSTATLFGIPAFKDSDFVSIHNGDGKLVFKIDEDSRVSVGQTPATASAIFDVNSTTRGFIKPRMTTAQRNLIPSPATGLEIYNTTTNEPEHFDGSVWTTTSGSETLAQTLSNGNVTGGTNIVISGGDTITAFGADNELQFNNGGVVAGTSGINFIATGRLKFDTGSLLSFGDNEELQIDRLFGISSLINFTGGFEFIQNGSDDMLFKNFGSANSTVFSTGTSTSATSIKFIDNVGGELAIFRGDGNVGIGVASPTFRLEVFDTEDEVARFSGDDNVLISVKGTIGSEKSINFINGPDVQADLQWKVGLDNNNGGGALDSFIIKQTNNGVPEFTIDTSGNVLIPGNVGIGTSIPDTKLHVQTGSGGAVTASAGTVLTVESSGAVFLSILSQTANEKGIYFGDSFSSTRGSLLFNTFDVSQGFHFEIENRDVFAILNDGTVGVNTITPDSSSIFDVTSITKGFLKPRQTTAQRDAIVSPTAGLEVYDVTKKEPAFYNGNNWKTITPDNVIDLRNIEDLPVAVSGSHIIPANTTIYLNAEIDLGANNLAPLGNLNIFGNGNFNSTLTSSNASGTVDLGILSGTINLTNMIIDNTNAANIAIALDNAGSSLICERVNAFADWVIGDFQFVNMERVTHFASQRFVKNAPLGTYTASISAFIQTSAINSIEIEPDVTIAEMNITFDVLFITTTGGNGILVEDSASVLRGTLNELEFVGTGTAVASAPISSSNFAPVGMGNLRSIAFDNDGNLIIVDSDAVTPQINQMVGITNVVNATIASPATTPRGVVWAKGNLISSDPTANTIYVHDGFSTTITTSFAAPAGSVGSLTFDGTNLISIDTVTNLVYIHDGISATILRTFSTPAVPASGITFDGVNLIVSDQSNTVYVLDGITGTLQYSFAGPGTTVQDMVKTDTGFIISDITDVLIYLFDHSVTFDHSSPTWSMTNLGGLVIESSDRGGSQFTDPNATGFPITVVQDEWTDIADAGANIFYGSFSTMEKSHLNDEINGEIIWTGARNRGRTLSGLATITRSGSAANRFYQISISINGIIQRDSIASGVLPDSSAFITLSTIPITRDLTKDDLVKIQIRNVTDTESPIAVSAKTAIN